VSAYLLATVVLFDSAGAAGADMPPGRYERDARSTGCFVVLYRRRVDASYAGIAIRGYFVWHDSADVIHFPFYRSPDAFYMVRARLAANGFVGGGTSGGGGVASIDGPRDTVVAVRRGMPDRLRCHAPG
jgi:hypothetical protein